MKERNAVAINLKQLREASGFTQEQLSGYLNINRSAYSNYESGSREVPIAILESLANLYGCDLFSLYEDNEDARKIMLATAFRVSDLSIGDMEQIAAFKNVVKNYLKLNALLEK